jgi:glutathione S-transferase
MYNLYHHPICPFSRKVRFYMSEKNIPHKLIRQDFWNHDQSFVRLNPMLTVPFMTAEGGVKIVGSQTIVEYFEELYPESNLMPIGIEDRAEVRRLINWFDDKFYNDAVRHIIGEKVVKFLKSGLEANQKILNFARRNIPYNLKYLQFLLKKRSFLASNLVTVADIAVASHISSMDYLGEIDWKLYPTLKEWYCIIKSRPSFKNILLDRISGFKPSQHYAMLDF